AFGYFRNARRDVEKHPMHEYSRRHELLGYIRVFNDKYVCLSTCKSTGNTQRRRDLSAITGVFRRNGRVRLECRARQGERRCGHRLFFLIVMSPREVLINEQESDGYDHRPYTHKNKSLPHDEIISRLKVRKNAAPRSQCRGAARFTGFGSLRYGTAQELPR